MMNDGWKFGLGGILVIPMLIGIGGCASGGGGTGISIDDVLNMNGNDNTPDDGGLTDAVELETFAGNTGGATGIAFRPSDGALFLVNPDGLFGPIEEGADVSTLTPIGATNLASAEIFDTRQNQFVLAITNAGEFWIGSPCCVTLGVVPPEGGDAAPFVGLLQGATPANISADTLVIVPDGFDGDQMRPGNLLVGEDTTFSRLAAIDVEGDRAVVNVDNPLSDAEPEVRLNRHANHLTFNSGVGLFSGRAIPAATIAGIQSIAEDGTPTVLTGTFGLGVDCFVVRANGDLVIRGSQRITGGEALDGILLWSAADQETSLGVSLPEAELSAGDEMIQAPDGQSILLSLPGRNEIVRVSDRT